MPPAIMAAAIPAARAPAHTTTNAIIDGRRGQHHLGGEVQQRAIDGNRSPAASAIVLTSIVASAN
jgi:hypothetical protein